MFNEAFLKLEVNTTFLRERAVEFPEPVRTLILEEKDRISFEKFIDDIGTWDRILKLMGANKK